MYNIYTTSGFIIGSKPYGEAGKILFIFTRDFGLIAAIAQGIRLEKSKLRYYAQEYSFGTFSLVKGKEFWRLTSVGEKEAFETAETTKDPVGRIEGLDDADGLLVRSNNDATSMMSTDQKDLVARIALLLKRFLQGEVAHPELFDCLKSGIDFLESTRDITDERLKTLESVMVFEILELLGYVGKDKALQELGISQNDLSIESTKVFSIEFLDKLTSKRVVINQHINKALRESQL